MSFTPHFFGRYVLLEPLHQNRHAETFLAKLLGNEGGPDRIVVLKKVVGSASEEDVVRTFEQEIKITVGLMHPNILQTYDFGKVEDQYFMVMEQISGPTLTGLSQRLAASELMFSAELSCHIVSQVCQALSYAHSYKDRVTGSARAVVHRDISPEKILLSYDGSVKLHEFGMARMESHEHFTRVGAIQGQPGYMSPERIFGEDLDGRADVYSLGVVLWEMLTGRPYRAAGKSLEEIRANLSEPVAPPSAFNPAVPKKLDAIVKKATRLKRDERYAHAADFQRDLHQFLYSHDPSFNPQDLALHLQELYRDEIVKEEERLRAHLQAPAPVPPAPRKEETLASVDFGALGNSTGFTGTGLVMSAQAYNKREMEKLFVRHVQKDHEEAELPISRSAGTLLLDGVSAGLLSAKLPVGDLLKPEGAPVVAAKPEWKPERPERRPAPRERAERPSYQPSSVALSKPSMRGAWAGAFVLLVGVSAAWMIATETGSGVRKQLVALAHELAAPAPKRVAEESVARVPAFAPARNGVDPLAGLALEADQGVVYFDGDTFGYELELDGKFTPVLNNRVVVKLNTPFQIRARKSGREDFHFEGAVRSTDAPLRVTLVFGEPRPRGLLSVLTPVEMKAKVYEGKSLVFEQKAPFEGRSLPVGRYRLVLEGSFATASEEEFLVEEQKTTAIRKAQ